MKTLIQNFVKQEMAPRELVTANGGHGMLYKASAAVASERPLVCELRTHAFFASWSLQRYDVGHWPAIDFVGRG